MTDDPFRGDGGRPEADGSVTSGATEYLTAPTVRARIQPKRSDAAFPPSWTSTASDLSPGDPDPLWNSRPEQPTAPDSGQYPRPPQYAQPQYAQPQYAQPPTYGAQPQYAQPQYAQPPTYGAQQQYAQPQYAQPPTYGAQQQYAQPQYAQPQYAQPPTYGSQPPAYGPQPTGYGATPLSPPGGVVPPTAARPGDPAGLGAPAGLDDPPGGVGRSKIVGVAAGLAVLLGLLGGGGWYLSHPRDPGGSAVANGPSSTTGSAPGEPSAGSIAPESTTDPDASSTPAPSTPAPSTPAPSTPTPSATVRPHRTTVEKLKAGDCVQKLTGTKISTVPVIDCAAPHEVQLVGLYTPRKGAYPGQKSLITTGATGCAPVVRSAVRENAPPVETVPLVPSEATWKSGNRRILCFVGATGAANLTESVVDTATV
jgi:hypothetical protein